jgi:hypothetical protein
MLRTSVAASSGTYLTRAGFRIFYRHNTEIFGRHMPIRFNRHNTYFSKQWVRHANSFTPYKYVTFQYTLMEIHQKNISCCGFRKQQSSLLIRIMNLSYISKINFTLKGSVNLAISSANVKGAVLLSLLWCTWSRVFLEKLTVAQIVKK